MHIALKNMRYSTLQEQEYTIALPENRRVAGETNESSMAAAGAVELKSNGPLEEGSIVSHLPLLFANGHPTSLEKITLAQLERFVTFMVECSLGHDMGETISEPRWWPKEVKFSNPLTRPRRVNENWMANLKKLVFRCYTYHRSEYLLRFCSYLARYPHEDLEYVNNWDSTTSLFHKNTGKLLVTFRNENMNYDKRFEKPRKKLLSCGGVISSYPSRSKQRQHSIAMVEPQNGDIYLCENCDAEFIGLEKMREHERVCCVQGQKESSPRSDTPDLSIVEPELEQGQFLEYFRLRSASSESKAATLAEAEAEAGTGAGAEAKSKSKSGPADPVGREDNNNVAERTSRRVRGSVNFTRCPTIPFSSPAGLLLAKKSKAMTEETQQERLERIERHLIAPVLDSSSKPKWLDAELDHDRWIVTYKPSRDKTEFDYVHQYRFVNSVKRKPMLSIESQLLYIVCRPVYVLLTRLTEDEISDARRRGPWKAGSLLKNLSIEGKDASLEEEEKSRPNVAWKRKAPSDESEECEECAECEKSEAPVDVNANANANANANVNANANAMEEDEEVDNAEPNIERPAVSEGKKFSHENNTTVVESIKEATLHAKPSDAITVIDLCSSDEEENPRAPTPSDENTDPMTRMANDVTKSLLQKLSSTSFPLNPRVCSAEQTPDWLPTSLLSDDVENYANKYHEYNVKYACKFIANP